MADNSVQVEKDGDNRRNSGLDAERRGENAAKNHRGGKKAGPKSRNASAPLNEEVD